MATQEQIQAAMMTVAQARMAAMRTCTHGGFKRANRHLSAAERALADLMGPQTGEEQCATSARVHLLVCQGLAAVAS
jgi:hypothetical protein